MKKLCSALLALLLAASTGLAVSARVDIPGAREQITADIQTTTGTVRVSATSYPDEAMKVVTETNARRQAEGIPALAWDPNLLDAAVLRGLESMVSFSHTRPNGQRSFSVSPYANGENLAKGDISALNVVTGWMGSPGHRSNILDTDFTTIATACLMDSQGTVFWVQVFGTANVNGLIAAQANDVVATVEMAIKQSAASTVDARVKNPEKITAAGLSGIANTARLAGKSVVIAADTMAGDGKSVQGRLYVEPAKMAGRTTDLLLGVYTDSASVAQTQTFFEKWFQNKVAVIRFSQQGSFGAVMHVAARVTLTGMDTAALRFYTYNQSTNQYTPIQNPNYSVDSAGYLHFYTNTADDVVITDREFVRK